MTLNDLAEKADVPAETVRNLYYGKVKNPKVETLFSLSEALNVSINYLLGKSIHTQEEELLLKSFRRCANHGKRLVLLIAQYEAELTEKERKEKDKRRIPCIVPLGEICDGLDYHSSEVIDVYTNKAEPYLAIAVTSNFFAPTYCKGDKVLISDRFPKNGERAVFSMDCTLYCRQFIEHDNGYTLKCLHRNGEDFHFKRMDKVNCIGTCIGIIRDE